MSVYPRYGHFFKLHRYLLNTLEISSFTDMPWNPEIYNEFKALRFKPFYDLIDLIQSAEQMKAIDLGCGTGEQTSILAEKFPDANFLGIDASADMLEKSGPFLGDRIRFQQANIEDLAESSARWDLIFSNAALQWSEHHDVLFPKLIRQLMPRGQFAIQMPVQTENILNQLLLKLAQEEPFENYLSGFTRTSPVLSMDHYAQLLFDSGLGELQVIQKVYPIIAPDHDTLYNFIAGSALIPYMERLQKEQRESFVREFKVRIAKSFPKLPAIYSFKRLLLYGRMG